MLGGSNYATYMAYDVIKNCNIYLYANTANAGYFLDKAKIVSFRMERTNNGIIDQAPNDNVVIEIANWSSIGSTYKTLMTTRGSYIKIGFSIENTTTTYRLVECVKDCKVNKRKNTATLTLQSPFALMSGFNFIAEVKGDIQDRSVFPPVEETYDNYDSFPLRVNTTFFESVQLASMSKGMGAVVPHIDNSITYPPAHKYEQPSFNQGDYYELVDLGRTTADVTINVKNITSDISESLDENDRSNIYFFGLKQPSGDPQILHTEIISASSGQELVSSWSFDKQYVVTSVLVQVVGNDLTNQFYWRISNNSSYMISKDPSQTIGYTYYFSALGYVAEEMSQDDIDAILDGHDYVYTILPTLVNGSTKLQQAQQKARAYYSHRTYIDFDCRLDPRIEPMDIVYVSGVGKIMVEKVTMQFNGAFKGHIRGRLIVAD